MKTTQKKRLMAAQAFMRIGRQIETSGEIESGLCYEVSKLYWGDAISPETYRYMNSAIRGYLTVYGSFAYGPWGGDEPMARAMAAYWLALEAKAEGK